MYLIIAVDYFTKWIEAKALKKITTTNIFKIFKNNLAQFEVPQFVVTDNGTQFINRKFKNPQEELKIKQHFSSVEHPQTNGKTEISNNVLVRD